MLCWGWQRTGIEQPRQRALEAVASLMQVVSLHHPLSPLSGFTSLNSSAQATRQALQRSV